MKPKPNIPRRCRSYSLTVTGRLNWRGPCDIRDLHEAGPTGAEFMLRTARRALAPGRRERPCACASATSLRTVLVTLGLRRQAPRSGICLCQLKPSHWGEAPIRMPALAEKCGLVKR